MSDTPEPPENAAATAETAAQDAAMTSPAAGQPPTSPASGVEGARVAVADGLDVLSRLLVGAGWAASGILLATSLGGVVALAIGLAVWHTTVAQVLLVVLLVAPCIVAPQVLRRRIGALVETATHPAEAASQARDLLSRIKPGGELHREVGRLRTVVADSGRGRTRRAVAVARATGGVLGMVEPDPERHRLLLPLRPERLSRLAAWAWASLWGPLLAGTVMAAALVTLVVRVAS